MGKVESGNFCCLTADGDVHFPSNRPLFLSDYSYFDKSFTVMFLDHMNLVQTAEFD